MTAGLPARRKPTDSRASTLLRLAAHVATTSAVTRGITTRARKRGFTDRGGHHPTFCLGIDVLNETVVVRPAVMSFKLLRDDVWS